MYKIPPVEDMPKRGWPEWETAQEAVEDLRNGGEAYADIAIESMVLRTRRERQISMLLTQLDNGELCERKDCEKALCVLASVHFCTPEATYGSNSSWALSDLCRAVSTLDAKIQAALNILNADKQDYGVMLAGIRAALERGN